jgi:hypothetical protein
VKESEKVYLTQQRNVALWWEPKRIGGHKLCGRIDISLTNQMHRRAVEEMLAEVERQLHHTRDRR